MGRQDKAGSLYHLLFIGLLADDLLALCFCFIKIEVLARYHNLPRWVDFPLHITNLIDQETSMFTIITKRKLFFSIASLVLLALIIGPRFVSSVRAGFPAQSAGSAGLTIAYPGQLTGDDGKAVLDGNYDFTFSLYDDLAAGNLLWSETQTGVRVHNGTFAVLLGSVNPLPEAAFTTKLWLSVSVRGPQSESFVELTPRQLLDEIAYSSPSGPSAVTGTCAHDHWFEGWVGNSADYGLRVENTGNGDGIRAVTASTNLTYAGVYAYNNATTGQGAGVYARSYSTTGYGVFGKNDFGIAIYGESGNGAGLSGKSTASDGIVGTTDAPGLSGIYGHAANGFGVTGQSTSSFGMRAHGNDASGDDTLGDLWLDGIRGEILTGDRLNLVSNWNVNIELDMNDDNMSSTFRIYANNVNAEVFSVDEAGNMAATGTQAAKVQTVDYGNRLLYALESTEVWFEDIGSAGLVEGKTEIIIESVFAQTVNLEDYQVFLTPASDAPVILYVVVKTPASFTVQGVTLDGKPAECSFDYRIIAKRLGYEDKRLQQPAEPEGEIK